ncbi:hypothetical protein [Buchananella felis]
MARLRRENAQLRQAGEILKAASTVFAKEHGPRLPEMIAFIDAGRAKCRG